MEKKLLNDALNSSKSTKTKRRRLKKGTIVDEEYVKVVDVGEGEGNIDTDIATLTEKKEAQEGKREDHVRCSKTKNQSL